MTMPGSMPLSFATTSIICWSSVAIHLFSHLQPGTGTPAPRNLGTLKFDFQPRALDLRERNPVHLPALREQDVRSVQPVDVPLEARLAAHRRRRHQLREPAAKPLIVRGAPERPVEADRKSVV